MSTQAVELGGAPSDELRPHLSCKHRAPPTAKRRAWVFFWGSSNGLSLFHPDFGIICKGFVRPRCRISEPSTVWHTQTIHDVSGKSLKITSNILASSLIPSKIGNSMTLASLQQRYIFTHDSQQSFANLMKLKFETLSLVESFQLGFNTSLGKHLPHRPTTTTANQITEKLGSTLGHIR